MKKALLAIGSIFVLLSFSGCGAKYSAGELRGSYNPTPINQAEKNSGAVIKMADGMGIWRVDGERVSNFIAVMFTKGLDSVIVSEGKHNISCSYGRDIHINHVYYKAGHEYFIDYLKRELDKKITIYYWVKDLTEDKVIAGKEVTVEDLEK